MTLALVPDALAVAVAAAGAVTDLRTGRIPNWLTFSAMALGLLLGGLRRGGPGVLAALLGLLVCGLGPLIMFRLGKEMGGAMQGGDVKLFAAVGALTGVMVGLEAELLALIAASVLALGKLAWQGKLLRTLGNTFFLAANPLLPRKMRRSIAPEGLERMRLGGAIFLGTLFAVALRHQALLL